jgi:hypothetical protein
MTRSTLAIAFMCLCFTSSLQATQPANVHSVTTVSNYDPAIECPKAENSERKKNNLNIVRLALNPTERGDYRPIIPADKALKELQNFVRDKSYADWCSDKFRTTDIRPTGPIVPLGKRIDDPSGERGPIGLGTHARVRVYYSVEVIEWLRNDRRGTIPKGAMIVKEMYPGNDSTSKKHDGWAVMIRDPAASHDGWLWYLYYPLLNKAFTVPLETAQYGLSFCVACHASAEKESTFAFLGNLMNEDVATYVELNNLQPGGTEKAAKVRSGAHGGMVDALQQLFDGGLSTSEIETCLFARHEKQYYDCLLFNPLQLPNKKPGGPLLEHLKGIIPTLSENSVHSRLPMDVAYDHVPAAPVGHDPGSWLTASNCGGCHGTSNLVNGTMPEMSVPIPPQGETDKPAVRYDRILRPITHTPVPAPVAAALSPYEEWSASLMSVAARDPVFRTQLEWEMFARPERAEEIESMCFKCHAPMAYRSDEHMLGKLAATYAQPDGNEPGKNARAAEFGALARDGVSCVVCHRIAGEGLGKPETFTGDFKLTTTDGLFGPYGAEDQLVTKPMQNAIGLTPVKGDHISSSGLCGSCHMVSTPVMDHPDSEKRAHEQTTYLEWRSSKFSRGRDAKQCHDCHMPKTNPFSKQPDKLVDSKIANIEDTTFPYVPNRLNSDEIDTVSRKGYSRHTLTGINLFTMSLFQQFPRLLGSNTFYPTRQLSEIVAPKAFAMEEAYRLAVKETANVEIVGVQTKGDNVEYTVEVTNLTGHKFPSGVGFRRAFLEFRVTSNDTTRWCSGCTNDAGVILDGNGEPLDAENPRLHPTTFEPNYLNIDRQNQAQIYESRHFNNAKNLTTSFLELDTEVKDTRLLPEGWKVAKEHSSYNMEPVGKKVPRGKTNVERIRYIVPKSATLGSAVATVQLHYQALPPYYLVDRLAPLGEADGEKRIEAQRLLHMLSRLNTSDGSSARHIKGWKLTISSDSRTSKR